MTLTLTNRAKHMIIVELNNGDPVYLQPGHTSKPIDDNQISGNETILKLQRKSDLLVNSLSESSGEGAQEPESASAEGDEEKKPARKRSRSQ